MFSNKEKFIVGSFKEIVFEVGIDEIVGLVVYGFRLEGSSNYLDFFVFDSFFYFFRNSWFLFEYFYFDSSVFLWVDSFIIGMVMVYIGLFVFGGVDGVLFFKFDMVLFVKFVYLLLDEVVVVEVCVG